jgi:hypothetical protein
MYRDHIVDEDQMYVKFNDEGLTQLVSAKEI